MHMFIYRYRKIASNKCHDGVTDEYSSKLTECPMIGPKGLQIVSEKSFIAKGTKAIFHLTQESVSSVKHLDIATAINGLVSLQI